MERFLGRLLIAGSFISFFSSSLSAQPESWSHPELRWFTIRTPHFDIHYHDNPYAVNNAVFKGPERTARLAAKIAEEIYEPVTKLYHHRPQRIHIIIRDTDDYSNGGAYYYDNKIEIWASSLDFELRGAHNWMRNVITHEFTHMVSIQAMMKFSRRIPGFYLQYIGYEKERRQDVLRGFPNVVTSYPVAGVNLPVWFAEGVAQYQQRIFDYEFWDSHRDMILRSRVLSGNMLSLNEMGTFGKNSIGNESAYNSGYALVSYMASKYGEDALEKICCNSSRLMSSFEGAVKDATGKSLQLIYAEWRLHLEKMYTQETTVILSSLAEGEAIPNDGTANLYPAFSPDGSRIAFLSNMGFDYLSQTSLYLYHVKSGSIVRLMEHAEGSMSWSPDGKKLAYSKNGYDNEYHSQVNDVYVYDLEKKKEYRLTKGLRAASPSFSPDGTSIAAVVNSDGTNNLIEIAGIPSNVDKLSKEFDDRTFAARSLSVRWLTHFDNGRQIYKPVFSPDGKRIIFDTSIDDGRDIAEIGADGTRMQFMVNQDFDERSPVFSGDGKRIYYASDETGIYNIYAFDLKTKTKKQLTNVIGGAFYPSISNEGQMVFTLYKDVGYQMSLLRQEREIPAAASPYHILNPNIVSHVDSARTYFYPKRWADYPKSYNDSIVPVFDSVRNYKTTFLNFSFLPVLRLDYGTLKPGVYFYSSDVLSKSSFFGGALMNVTDFDRDLFGIFEYGGLGPTLFLELYNITRTKTFSDDGDPSNDPGPGVPDSIGVLYESIQRNTFELRELDAGVDLSFFKPRDVRLNFAHVESYVQISGKEFRGTAYVDIPKTGGIKYFYGNDLSVQWKSSTLKNFVDGDINPRGGRKWSIQYGYYLDNLLNGFAFNSTTGSTTELYNKNHYHRVEGDYSEYFKMPVKDHTLEMNFHGGIMSSGIDSFFNFFGGGLVGLKGYSYYSLEGNKLAVLNTTYRFPIWKHIGARFLNLYLDKIFGGLYFGYGTAWSDKPAWRKSIGGELRLEFYSFYVYPTRVTVNAVYGLDKFNSSGPLVSVYDQNTGVVSKANQQVENGKEWKFYLTILFGFTLFD